MRQLVMEAGIKDDPVIFSDLSPSFFRLFDVFHRDVIPTSPNLAGSPAGVPLRSNSSLS